MKNVCRHCGSPLKHSFCDLGMSPLANSYLTESQMDQPETFYPLHAYVCSDCLLVQVGEFQPPDSIFNDYAYFSSYSQSWLDHAQAYAQEVIPRFSLDRSTQVIEIASNDGYLLKNFVEAGIPALGIEPAENVAAVARQQGIPTETAFFGAKLARELVDRGTRAKLLIGNNVLAHVPDLNDFVAGMSLVLAPGGVITMEFPHVLQLIMQNQFDTIYHEHFSYFSLLTVARIFAAYHLRIFDVEQLDTHGGSLRIYACHTGFSGHETTDRVRECGGRRVRGTSRQPRGVPRLSRACGARETQAAAILDRHARLRIDDGGLRRAGQGQHPAELLRYP